MASLEHGGREATRQLCTAAVVGSCRLAPEGSDECPRGIHGGLCSSCGRFCLHPQRPDESEAHVRECVEKRWQREVQAERLQASVAVEW